MRIVAGRNAVWFFATVSVLLAAVHCAPTGRGSASPAPQTAPASAASSSPSVQPATSAQGIGENADPGDLAESTASALSVSSNEPGWLGVELTALPPEKAGVQIREVFPGSPAQAAGLHNGDVILQIDGTAAQRPQQVIAAVLSHRMGDRVGLVLVRQGQQRLINVTLGRRLDTETLLRQRYLDAPAPDLTTGQVAQGKVQSSLRSLRGRVVVLEFWASWCMPCRALFPTLNAWHDQYSAQGVTVIGVTADAVGPAALNASTLGMRYNIIADPDATITRDYRALALPTLFVIDKRGNVRDVMVGFQPDHMTQIEQLLERLLQES